MEVTPVESRDRKKERQVAPGIDEQKEMQYSRNTEFYVQRLVVTQFNSIPKFPFQANSNV